MAHGQNHLSVSLAGGFPAPFHRHGVAGDTATGATKEVTLETGVKVRTPLFVQVDDVIRVDTRTGEYITRV